MNKILGKLKLTRSIWRQHTSHKLVYSDLRTARQCQSFLATWILIFNLLHWSRSYDLSIFRTGFMFSKSHESTNLLEPEEEGFRLQQTPAFQSEGHNFHDVSPEQGRTQTHHVKQNRCYHKSATEQRTSTIVAEGTPRRSGAAWEDWKERHHNRRT